jgi:hypothetical protein
MTASGGWIDYPGHIWVAAWNEGAFYSPDGMIIQFDSGSLWQRVVEVPIVAPVVRRHYRHSTTVTRTTTVRPGVVAAAPVYDAHATNLPDQLVPLSSDSNHPAWAFRRTGTKPQRVAPARRMRPHP